MSLFHPITAYECKHNIPIVILSFSNTEMHPPVRLCLNDSHYRYIKKENLNKEEKKTVKMSTLGNLVFNWEVPCQPSLQEGYVTQVCKTQKFDWPDDEVIQRVNS